MGKRVRKCRICKKNPIWQGGDVKNPGPVCKRCYHKRAGFSGGGKQAKAASNRVYTRRKRSQPEGLGDRYAEMEINRLIALFTEDPDAFETS